MRKNEPVAANRRTLIYVFDIDGSPADPTTTFTATGEMTADRGTGDFVPALGTLTNSTEPLVVADFTFTADNATEIFTHTAHGLETGDGPIRVASDTTLPAGLTAGTDYWVIYVTDNTFKLATTRALALAGTNLLISTNGTGVHTLSDTASTVRLVWGAWRYEALQAETNYVGSYFAVRLKKDGVVREAIVQYDLDISPNDEIMEGAITYGDADRAQLALHGNAVGNFNTGTLVYKSVDGAKNRWTTVADVVGGTGRLSGTPGDLTP